MNDGQVRSSPTERARSAARCAGTAPLADADGPPAADLRRRRLRHDIRHGLGTIIMLASAVAVADDVGAASRARVEQLLGETRWLDHLLRRLEAADDNDDDNDDNDAADGAPPEPAPEPIRVDELAAEAVTGIRLATSHRVLFDGREAWARADPVALWRALRNVLDNACRMAEGRVEVRVEAAHGWVVVQVDDDGPGFGGYGGAAADQSRHGARPGRSPLGLGIVHDIVSGHGGALEIRTCEMGGARVRLLLPAAPPARAAASPAVSSAVSADAGRARP